MSKYRYRPFPCPSHMMEVHTRQTNYRKHIFTIQNVKSIIDTTRPPTVPRLETYRRRVERERKQQREFDNENLRYINELEFQRRFSPATRHGRTAIVRPKPSNLSAHKDWISALGKGGVESATYHPGKAKTDYGRKRIVDDDGMLVFDQRIPQHHHDDYLGGGSPVKTGSHDEATDADFADNESDFDTGDADGREEGHENSSIDKPHDDKGEDGSRDDFGRGDNEDDFEGDADEAQKDDKKCNQCGDECRGENEEYSKKSMSQKATCEETESDVDIGSVIKDTLMGKRGADATDVKSRGPMSPNAEGTHAGYGDAEERVVAQQLLDSVITATLSKIGGGEEHPADDESFNDEPANDEPVNGEPANDEPDLSTKASLTGDTTENGQSFLNDDDEGMKDPLDEAF